MFPRYPLTHINVHVKEGNFHGRKISSQTYVCQMNKKENYFHVHLCNDRPFYVVILEGYSVVGVCIVVVGRSRWMLGCLGNLVLCSHNDGGGPGDNTCESVSLSRALIVCGTKEIRIVICMFLYA